MSTDLVKRYEQLLKEKDRLTRLKYQKEAELNQATQLFNDSVSKLKEDYDVKSLSEARQLLSFMQNELQQLTDQLDKDLQQFEGDSYEL